MKPNRIVDESTQGKFSWESPPFHGWDGRRFFEYGLHYCFCKIVFVVFIAASLGLDKTDGFKPYSIQSPELPISIIIYFYCFIKNYNFSLLFYYGNLFIKARETYNKG
jgi:hypothetical protein